MFVRESIVFFLGLSILVIVAVATAGWANNRPPTCEMGKMKSCHGGGIQFCQHDHYTPCYDIKPHHLYPGQDPKP